MDNNHGKSTFNFAHVAIEQSNRNRSRSYPQLHLDVQLTNSTRTRKYLQMIFVFLMWWLWLACVHPDNVIVMHQSIQLKGQQLATVSAWRCVDRICRSWGEVTAPAPPPPAPAVITAAAAATVAGSEAFNVFMRKYCFSSIFHVSSLTYPESRKLDKQISLSWCSWYRPRQ